MRYISKYGYKEHINFNFDITELKDNNSGSKLLNHIQDNTERYNDPELINKNPELKDVVLKSCNIEKLIEKSISFTQNHKKAGKGHKPFRFGSGSINLAPTKENQALIEEWSQLMFQHFSKYYNIKHFQVHLNETAPHFHFIAQNFDSKLGWGNFVNGKKIVLSGEKGRALTEKIWREGEKITADFCKRHNLTFKQEPYSPKRTRLNEKNFRKSIGKISKGEPLNSSDSKSIKYYLKTEEGQNLLKSLNLLQLPEPKKKISGSEVDSVLKSWGPKVKQGETWKSYSQLLKEGETASKKLAEIEKNKVSAVSSPVVDKQMEVAVSNLEDWLKRQFPNQIPQDFKLKDFALDIELNLDSRMEQLKQRSRDYLKEHPELTRSKGGAVKGGPVR